MGTTPLCCLLSQVGGRRAQCVSPWCFADRRQQSELAGCAAALREPELWDLVEGRNWTLKWAVMATRSPSCAADPAAWGYCQEAKHCSRAELDCSVARLMHGDSLNHRALFVPPLCRKRLRER